MEKFGEGKCIPHDGTRIYSGGNAAIDPAGLSTALWRRISVSASLYVQRQQTKTLPNETSCVLYKGRKRHMRVCEHGFSSS